VSILGEVVSEISGISYEQYVIDNILKPLGLEDVRPELPESERHKKLATGYSIISRDGIRDELGFFQARGIAPAAGYSSSVKGLAKFASWQFKIIDDIDNEVLNGNTLKEMQRVQWLNPDLSATWGLGFDVNRINGLTIVGHSGGCAGYRTQLQLIPEKKWAFVFMVNACGIETYTYVRSMFRILSSYEKAKIEKNEEEINFDDFCGRYYDIWRGESIIVPWKGKLALYYLYSSNQSNPEFVMQHSEGDIFKIIGNDKTATRYIQFERDENGKVLRFWSNSNPFDKTGSLK